MLATAVFASIILNRNSEPDLGKLDTLLSNFAEARIDDFTPSSLDSQTMIGFALEHVTWNDTSVPAGARNRKTSDYPGLVEDPDDGGVGIIVTAVELDSICKRYLGRTPTHKVRAYFADGLEPMVLPNVDRVFRVEKLKDGQLELSAVEYEHRGNPGGSKAEIKRNRSAFAFRIFTVKTDSKVRAGYVVTAQKTITRTQMEKKLSRKSFPMPR